MKNFSNCTDRSVRKLVWAPAIFASMYNGSLIVLNARQDEFLILPNKQANEISDAYGRIENTVVPCAIEIEFIDAGLLAYSNKFTPFVRDDKIARGVFSCEWSMPTVKPLGGRVDFRICVRALVDFLAVSRAKRQRSLENLLNRIPKVIESPGESSRAIIDIASSIEFSIKLSRGNPTCMEWAFALACAARRRGIDCKFVIGVQTHPFVSHAWVEHQGKVLFDSPELAACMARLIEIPAK